MNYKPFSGLVTGAICRDLDHAHLLLIKTDLKNRAKVLESVWIDNKLYPRGTLVEMADNECVIAVEERADLALPLKRNDPVDPRRRFWAIGDTRSVCPDHPARINLFAGLFLYSGFGMGHYYSAVDDEGHLVRAHPGRGACCRQRSAVRPLRQLLLDERPRPGSREGAGAKGS